MNAKWERCKMSEKSEKSTNVRDVISRIRGVYFWKRLAIFSGWTFLLYAVAFRLIPDLLPLTIIVMLILMGWTFFGMFRKVSASKPNKKKMRPVWQRIIAGVLLAPLAFVTAVGTGAAIGLAIKPYSAQELAEREAVAAAEARAEVIRVAAEKKQKAEEAKRAEDKAEADRLAEEERKKSEETKRVAEENKKQAEAELALDEDLEAEIRKVEELKGSNPLVYAAQYCGLTLWGSAYGASEYVLASDDGSTLFMTTKSAEDIVGEMVLICVSDALEFSGPLRASISSTNALAGTKTFEENKLSYEWSYHPSVGLNMSVIRKKDCFLGFC